MINVSLREMSRLLNNCGPRIKMDIMLLLSKVEWENVSNNEITLLIDVILRLRGEAIIISNSDSIIEKDIKNILKYVQQKLSTSQLLNENEELRYYFDKFSYDVSLI